VRAEAYRALGLETICRTVILADALAQAAIEGAEATGAMVLAPTAEPLRGAPVEGSKAARKAEQDRADAAETDAAETDAAEQPTSGQEAG
jgi:hypothetical protein